MQEKAPEPAIEARAIKWLVVTEEMPMHAEEGSADENPESDGGGNNKRKGYAEQ